MNAIVPLSLIRPGEARVSWDDEAVETAKRLSAEGRSAAEIARALSAEHPGITRNAVIGNLHRLGCAGGGRQPNGDVAQTRVRARLRPQALLQSSALTLRPIWPRSHQRQLAPVDAPSRAGKGRAKRIFNLAPSKAKRWVDRDVPAPEFIGITVVDLSETTCRWPHGDPSDLEAFRYCGAQAEAERPYCPHHCGLAYVGTAAPFAKATERNRWLMKA